MMARAGVLIATLSLVASPAAPSRTPEPVFPAPRWNQSLIVRAIRRTCLGLWLLPLTRLFAWTRVHGLEHLAAVDGPVVFAANHQSFMDTPVILAALPRTMRYRVTTAMAKEFFAPHFHPEGHTRCVRFTNGLNYYLSTALFNAFLLPHREAGARHARERRIDVERVVVAAQPIDVRLPRVDVLRNDDVRRAVRGGDGEGRARRAAGPEAGRAA